MTDSHPTEKRVRYFLVDRIGVLGDFYSENQARKELKACHSDMGGVMRLYRGTEIASLEARKKR